MLRVALRYRPKVSTANLDFLDRPRRVFHVKLLPLPVDLVAFPLLNISNCPHFAITLSSPRHLQHHVDPAACCR